MDEQTNGGYGKERKRFKEQQGNRERQSRRESKEGEAIRQSEWKEKEGDEDKECKDICVCLHWKGKCKAVDNNS